MWLNKVPLVNNCLGYGGGLVCRQVQTARRGRLESHSQGKEGRSGAGKDKETYCPRSLQKGGSPASSRGTSAPQKRKSPASPRGSFALQKCTMLNVCCLKPLRVWQSIPTATVFNTNNTLTHFRYAKLDCLGFGAQAIFLSKLHPHCVSYGQCSREILWSAVATG